MSIDPFDMSDLGGADLPPEGPPPSLLDGLNTPQRDAVENLDGPLLVLAGAGTGKTRVLTTRLAYLMREKRVAPWQVLAVTFTNKAAAEMKIRVEKRLERPVDDMWVGTFHALCVKILRRHAELVGLKPNFTILDTDDQIRLLKQLLEAEGIDHKKHPARQLASCIDRWKNRALTPDKLPGDEKYSFADGKGQALYKQYQDRLATINAADFGDLLLHVVTIFQQHPDILGKYQAQFRYILVDEYQDTNVAQYLWLRLLAQKHKNICCVGDDDQSIYGWRGAEVGNILRFEKDFPGARVVRLEQNYRSTGNILKAASHLITANEDRLGKTLWTESDDGDPVKVKGVWDAPEEARWVCDEIEALQTKGHSLSEMAILVRAGFQTREFEERLIALGLPYRVIGGPRFYERAEIRDALAYFRVVLQPDDDLAFERIVNVPKRGLGATSLQKVHHLSRQAQVSLYRAADMMADLDELRAAARTSLGRVVADFERWRSLVKTESHIALAEQILEESGYVEMWQKDKSPEAPGRLDNLKELINALAEFESLQGFMEHIALVMDNDARDDTAKISLMTLHAAKGLEFDTVFLPGWEEGVFPNQRALDESGARGLEEERRLAYVGLTRARHRAIVVFAANRQVFGQWQSSLPSRFIDELPQDEIEMEEADGLMSSRNSSAYTAAAPGWGDTGWGQSSFGQETAQDKYGPGWHRRQSRKPSGFGTGQSGPKVIEGNAVTVTRKSAKPVSEFAVGERVFHSKFGYGTVEDVEGNKLLVAFDKAGEKRVMDSFVVPADQAS